MRPRRVVALRRERTDQTISDSHIAEAAWKVKRPCGLPG
jgi:hypothetical protein